MDRRESLKSLMVASVAGAAFVTTSGCKVENTDVPIVANDNLYGRTASEKEWDEEVTSKTFFTEQELETIATLCDIILPATDTAGSATEAEVPAFIEFIVKDLPSHQLPLRGGVAWLNGISRSRYDAPFVDSSAEQQIEIIEDIAYPDPDNKKPDMAVGISFFDRMRNLTMTGYYTSRMGIKDLGYKGNIPNIWDGVPDEVLQDHDVEYDQEWLAKCVDQSKREDIAEWDDDMNLIS